MIQKYSSKWNLIQKLEDEEFEYRGTSRTTMTEKRKLSFRNSYVVPTFVGK